MQPTRKSYSAAILFLVLAAGAERAAATDAPTLVSPADGNTSVTLDGDNGVTLSWSPVPGAILYTVQAANAYDSLFLGSPFPLMANQTIDSTHFHLPNLGKGAKYFWRVQASDDATVSAWSRAAFTTLPDPPGAPMILSPATGATDVSQTPNLSWMIMTGVVSTWHLQVAADSGMTALAYEDSTLPGSPVMAMASRMVGPLQTGTKYFWRVQGKNVVGAGSWSPIASFTVTQHPLAPVLLLAPSDRQTGVPIRNTQVAWNDTNPPPDSQTIIVGMPKVAVTRNYLLQVATDSTFPPSVVPPMPGFPPMPPYILNGSTTRRDTTLPVLTFNTIYYWRVQIVDGSKTGPWSPVFSFTAQPPPPTTITLIAPSQGSVDVTLTPKLQWSDNGAVPTYQAYPAGPIVQAAYLVQICGDSTFPPMVQLPALPPNPPYFFAASVQPGGDTVAVNPPLPRGMKFYWRVMFPMANGGDGSFAKGSFTTIPVPPIVATPIAPTPDSMNFPVKGRFVWSKPAGATAYLFEMSDSIDFRNPIDTLVADTAFVFSGLAYSHHYYWHVQAKNAGGDAPFSVENAFTTAPPAPAAPLLDLPGNGYVNLSPGQTLRWHGSAGVTSYLAEMSLDPAFATLTLADSSLTDTSKVVGPLAKGETYYWRVRAKNPGGAGDWSAVWHFTVEPPPPAGPVLVAPANGSVDAALGPTLIWRAARFAATYAVQVALDSAFASPLIDLSGFADTTKNIGPLENGKTYYWRVMGTGHAGPGDWSAISSFRTVPPPPAVPVAISPDSNGADVSLSPTLTWHAVPTAVKYHYTVLRVAPIDSGAMLVPFDTGYVADTTVTVSSLLNDKLYYWVISAVNSGGASDWTVIRPFTTIVALPSPVTLLLPAAGDTVRGDSLAASWNKGGPKADRYLVQISRDSAFATSISDSAVADTAKRSASPEPGLYWWRVKAHNAAGWGDFGSARAFVVASPATAVPKAFALHAFGLSAGRISYALPEAAHVKLEIWDFRGRRVAAPVDAQQAPGFYTVNLGPALRTQGWYFLRFDAGEFQRRQKFWFGR